MSNVILACEILKDEINKALLETKNNDSIIWIDSSLHMFPKKLNAKLQEEIDKLDCQGNIENILFSFGYCGNAIVGLKSLQSNLIIPQINDCIEMFLYDNPAKNTIRSQGCYFLTKGWMQSQYSIVHEFDRYVKRYGAERTKKIMDIMLAHYHYLTLIDTGTYSIEDYTPIANEAAEKLDLQLNIQKGSIQLLVKLFSQVWDDNFCIVPKGIQVSFEHFSVLHLAPSQGQITG
jgi:hypothetical protein